MLLSGLGKLHAKLRRNRSLQKPLRDRNGLPLKHSVSRGLKDDLEEQHKLHNKYKVRLLTLSPNRVHEIVEEVETIGVPHETAKKVLIANGYDYDKAITQLINHLLKSLDPKERQWTSLAIARLIDPADLDWDMDCVLEAMLRKPKQPWKALADLIETPSQKKEAHAARRRRKLDRIAAGRTSQGLKGDVSNVEQD